MKNIVILFVHKYSSFIFEKVFDGNSAMDMSLKWAESLNSEKIFVFSSVPENKICAENLPEVVYKDQWSVLDLFEKMLECASGYNAENIIYAWADCPFLDKNLTDRCMDAQCEFSSEYTYAEGYPYGLSPEIINSGTVNILCELARSTYPEAGKKVLSRTGIFDFLKNDINSFEIETVLSDEDWRLFRFSFSCDRKSNFLGCQALFQHGIMGKNCDEISEAASKISGIIKTVPSYYNLQISKKIHGRPLYYPDFAVSTGDCMSFDDAEKIIDKIMTFSDDGVINLSWFGEPLSNPELPKIVEKILSNEKFSVFIETDGLSADETLVNELASISEKFPLRANNYEKIMFAVVLDSFTKEKYSQILNRPESDFDRALVGLQNLSKAFPDSTYVQFTRMNENEDELESFFRFWNEKTSPAGGKMIINKYNDFAGLLPARKPADLSPVNRNVCWHLRRDMTILCNGDVLFCQNCNTEETIGNILRDDIESVWKKTDSEISCHIDGKYCDKCRACDEYYTFNF